VKYVAYLRVSTARQGALGLGLDAQRIAIQRLVDARGGLLLDSFVDATAIIPLIRFGRGIALGPGSRTQSPCPDQALVESFRGLSCLKQHFKPMKETSMHGWRV
jgi:hypothetical protein